MELIKTGKIVNLHGLKGEVKAVSWADTPDELLELETLTVDGREYTVTRARLQGSTVLFKLEGVDTPEEAEKLRNKVIYAQREEFELEEGVYFWDDLLDMDVKDEDTGELYGKLTDILQTGANDVYEITAPEGKKLYIPAIPGCIISVSVPDKLMTVRPLKGMFDI